MEEAEGGGGVLNDEFTELGSSNSFWMASGCELCVSVCVCACLCISSTTLPASELLVKWGFIFTDTHSPSMRWDGGLF